MPPTAVPRLSRRLDSVLRPTPDGLWCPGGAFFIDPPRPIDRAVITHGHADHARVGHGSVLATPETLAIMAERYGEDFAGHAQSPPRADLLAWLDGRAERPAADAHGRFRPVMLAQPIDEAEKARLDPAAWAAEWKWDGIRVQAVSEGGVQRQYSRTGRRHLPDLSRRAGGPDP